MLRDAVAFGPSAVAPAGADVLAGDATAGAGVGDAAFVSRAAAVDGFAAAPSAARAAAGPPDCVCPIPAGDAAVLPAAGLLLRLGQDDLLGRFDSLKTVAAVIERHLGACQTLAERDGFRIYRAVRG